MDIKIKESLGKEKKHWKEIVPQEYHDFPEVFKDAVFEKLPEHHTWDHVINFKEGMDIEKLKCPVYPLLRAEQDELKRFLKENLDTGRIRMSDSPVASPFFFVKKKTADLRPVQDYQEINKVTIKNRYPLPIIQEIMDKLKDAIIFTKMDIRKGYNNI